MSSNLHTRHDTSPHTRIHKSMHTSIHTSIYTRIYTTTYVHPRYQVFKLLTAAQRTNGDGELGGGGGGGGEGGEGGGGEWGGEEGEGDAKKQVNTFGAGDGVGAAEEGNETGGKEGERQGRIDSVERQLSRVTTDEKWLLLSLLVRGDIFFMCVCVCVECEGKVESRERALVRMGVMRIYVQEYEEEW